jgi:hypothetical protein
VDLLGFSLPQWSGHFAAVYKMDFQAEKLGKNCQRILFFKRRECGQFFGDDYWF